jgi:Family of unknown function (DUF6510)
MDQELILDGNAAAGLLREIFTREMTDARGSCGSCGAVEQLGGEQVYSHAPGAVVRCRHCDHILMVVVHGGGRYWLGFQGLRWLELSDQP